MASVSAGLESDIARLAAGGRSNLVCASMIDESRRLMWQGYQMKTRSAVKAVGYGPVR